MNDSDLLSLEILPLSKVKATLSEQVQKTQGRRRIAITSNGLPKAILLSYEDFLELLARGGPRPVPARVLRYDTWKNEESLRRKARHSVLGLFDMKALSRKGQKTYKRETVRELDRNLKKRP
ncbi:MAG: type II toxin-antitoxin system prevent-host-death family antitoxin [Deltaproteobacteria bacterium]|nr:type II toxin-antitoxin system prevent-host-death family antitoxin [Deltaproteobacteria bacterium]